MRLSLIAANARFVHAAPALFYLRQGLERNLPGGRLTFHQFTINDPYYDTLLAVLAGEPAAVLISAYVWSDAFLRRLIVDLRQARPELPIVVGGPQAPHLRLPAGVAISVVEGAVEGLPPDFYADLAAGRLRPHYQAAAGTDFAMPYRPEDFGGELRHRHIYYESSRGCPFACSYCLSSAQAGVRYLELEQVKGELAQILAHRPRIIRFVDRTFNAPPERALALWRWLAAQSGETRFHFEIAPDLFTSEQRAFLATVPAGRFQFEIGLQTFNPEALAAVNRRPDLARAKANIRQLLAANNIHLHLDLILGLPFETRESYRRALAEVLALAPHHLQLGLLKVLPATPLAARQAEFGLVCCQEPPYPVLASRWLPQPELAELYRLGEMIEAFYNPRFFRATLAWLQQNEAEPLRFYEQLAELCRCRDFFSRAKTQESMGELLAELFNPRPDADLARELLVFDWLACGHRTLPPQLASGNRLRQAQELLWQQLPDQLPPYFTSQSRSQFFKRTVFAPFAAATLGQLGLADGRTPGIVAFLAETDGGLQLRQATIFFAGFQLFV